MEFKKNDRQFHTHKQIKALLVFFSGTGGVKIIADAFENLFIKKNIPVIKHSLDQPEFTQLKKNYKHIIENATLLLLLYPVHAFSAPLPVFNWIEELPFVSRKPTAIISVSGGGEVLLNRASRYKCINALEMKGCHVFYETMMVMPSNWYIPTHDHLAIRLLQCIPEKVKQVLDPIISGTRRRTRVRLMARIAASFISRLEKRGTKKFGAGLRVSGKCTQCMWCIGKCPRENIYLFHGNIQFGKKCIMCFRCIYGCPHKAIYPTKGKFMVIKEGFNLGNLEKRMAGIDLEPLEILGKKILWHGVIKYLLR